MKKIKYLEYFPIIIISFLAYRLVNEKALLLSVGDWIKGISTPFIWALVLSYFVNSLVCRFEKNFAMKRFPAIISSYIIISCFLGGFFTIIVPFLSHSIPSLINEMLNFAENFDVWYAKFSHWSVLNKISNTYNLDIQQMIIEKIEHISNIISKNFQAYMLQVGKTVFSITAGLLDFLIGLVISVYVLKDKEKLFSSARNLSASYFGENFTKKICSLIGDIDEIFGKYFVGKSLDSLVIAVICYVGLLILRVKYALLFALIIGVTNMVPYFGPMIGAIPAVLITIFDSPIKALWTMIFVLVLQQVDGNIIGPKIIGDKIGLSPLWIVISVFLGGKLFGFWGMLLGVPIFTLIRKLVLDKQQKI